MIEKVSDFVSGAFIVFYVAFSHFYEMHVLCLVAAVAGLHLVAKGILGHSPIRHLISKTGKRFAARVAR